MLVVSGPALEGKGPLAEALRERIPDVVVLGRPDDLSAAPEPVSALLASARAAWRGRRSAATTILVVGRFPTPAARRAAAAAARAEGMAFLLVESTSSVIRSLRQVSRAFLPPREAAARMKRYEDARAAYVVLDAAERESLPASSLRAVLSDVQGAAERVTAAWALR